MTPGPISTVPGPMNSKTPATPKTHKAPSLFPSHPRLFFLVLAVNSNQARLLFTPVPSHFHPPSSAQSPTTRSVFFFTLVLLINVLKFISTANFLATTPTAIFPSHSTSPTLSISLPPPSLFLFVFKTILSTAPLPMANRRSIAAAFGTPAPPASGRLFGSSMFPFPT